jgi:triphosphoribosyl-dephospho-CoA synthase
MSKPLLQDWLEPLVMRSFITEVNALKPGNTSCYVDGHGMTSDDFIRSAELVTPILCNSRLTLGERIQQSVHITKVEIGCNTNLGMLLLFTPVIMSTQRIRPFKFAALQNVLLNLLASLDKSNSVLVFQAITEANPGGLGQSKKYDVNSLPECSLQEAMAAAQNRDLIAKQYVTAYADVFLTGYPCIKEFTRRWNSVEWATVGCYLTFLSTFTDTHIARKYGTKLAEQIKTKAGKIAKQFNNNDNPGDAMQVLLEFDKELKYSNINPGTTADLTATSVLIYELSIL